MTALCRLIHAQKAHYPVVLLCRVLHVTRSSYYACREGEAARQARQAADDALAHEITVLHIASRKTYGVPRIHAELRRLGRRVNRKRIARVMRERHPRRHPSQAAFADPTGREGEAGGRVIEAGNFTLNPCTTLLPPKYGSS
ncbi:IS3 family transposase (plasmid) [Streptomyces poriferorum]|uniref:IS3 family transposase n=1 Tax=Streptomyces poriferorum TaxID=2798799 RepID=UPI00273EE5F3|nr:IS3 family transposase [Streptomyces sp. Alt1]WLQ53648.1 IS3 family transposase [Streptomyces sp. Alt1]